MKHKSKILRAEQSRAEQSRAEQSRPVVVLRCAHERAKTAVADEDIADWHDMENTDGCSNTAFWTAGNQVVSKQFGNGNKGRTEYNIYRHATSCIGTSTTRRFANTVRWNKLEAKWLHRRFCFGYGNRTSNNNISRRAVAVLLSCHKLYINPQSLADCGVVS